MKAYALITLLLCHMTVVLSLVTLQTIREITNVTEECRVRITGKGAEEKMQIGVGIEGVGEQSIFAAGGDDEDEEGDDIENTVSAALKILCSTLLIELEKPLDGMITISPQEPTTEDLRCRVIIREYHQFLGATVKFLYEIQQRQMRWNWGDESPVFEGVGWLQGLWASRRTNDQERSFIEQQLAFYGPTGCFGKSQEVLRRDVEVVEYMNDLIDSFK